MKMSMYNRKFILNGSSFKRFLKFVDFRTIQQRFDGNFLNFNYLAGDLPQIEVYFKGLANYVRFSANIF